MRQPTMMQQVAAKKSRANANTIQQPRYFEFGTQAEISVLDIQRSEPVDDILNVQMKIENVPSSICNDQAFEEYTKKIMVTKSTCDQMCFVRQIF